MRLPMVLGFVAAIVLGLAAGAGAKLALERPATEGELGAVPDSVAVLDSADSTRRAPDSTQALSVSKPAAPAAPAVVAGPAIALPRPPVAAKAVEAVKKPAPDSVAVIREREREAARQAARERLARMFAAMEPKGAAAVLEQLDDEEAARVLGTVSERQAGKILEYFTPQRAAGVSRALLNGSRSTP